MKSKYFVRIAMLVGAAVAVFALFASAAQAKEPKPGFARFAGCPSPEEDAEVEFCWLSTITGGHFQMGNKDVPIANPITLSGGLTEFGKFVYNSKGGLSPVKQLVPGGIIGLTGLDWLVNFLNLEGLKLYAVTEAAGTIGNPASEPKSLPIKVHLINPVLGSNCYVGSNSNPINLNLRFGTTNPPPPNKPISGTEPEVSIQPPGIFTLKKGVVVDNEFAAPGASGCVLTLFGFIPVSINGLVNSQSGLPSPAGTNETKQNTDTEFLSRGFVY